MKETTNQSIVEQIQAVIDDNAPPPEMRAQMEEINKATQQLLMRARMEFMITAGLYVDDSMVAHGHLVKSYLFRTIANSLLQTAAFIVRAAKRMEGGELEAARFALVAFSIADAVGGEPIEHQEFFEHKPGELRKALEEDFHEASVDQLHTSSQASAPTSKGDYGQECNRTACSNEPATWWNRETLKHYCEPCGKLINVNNRQIDPPLCAPTCASCRKPLREIRTHAGGPVIGHSFCDCGASADEQHAMVE